jgi:hypothetical protein
MSRRDREPPDWCDREPPDWDAAGAELDADGEDDRDAPQARDLGATDDDETPTAPCPHCGAEVAEMAERCPACGEYIVWSAVARRGRRWWPAWVALAAVAALLLWVAR